ncbi:aminoglycoside phosphotransferase family protein [Thermoleophilia bacterium SCSIO 60948]|nr:aminoglycoside phosphotransferase family protein [Thermoleophilia bacterium SCSIO 60948]
MDQDSPHGAKVWSSERWRSDALSWARGRLRRDGCDFEDPAAGDWRVVPWSVVVPLRRPGGAPVWFKACAPETAFEVAIYRLLGRAGGDAVLTPLAVDDDRGWLLLPDAGTTLRDRDADDELPAALVAYAALQREIEPIVSDLVAAGVPDMRPARMARRFDEACEAMAAEGSGSPELDRRLEAIRPSVIEWAAELSSSPIAPSVDHQDLHHSNVTGDAASGYRFYDWGDAVVGHPFGAMMVPLGFAVRRLGFEEGGADFERFRDAYLEPFTDLRPLPELVRELELACRLALIARALGEQRALEAPRRLGEPLGFEWPDPVAIPLRALAGGDYIH